MRWFFLIIFFFTGCSYKINPNEYYKINAKKSEFIPKSNIYAKTNILIAPFESDDKQLNHTAQTCLKNLLNSYPPVKVLNRKFTSIKDEIKLSEISKLNESEINQADYVIFGKVLDNYIKKTYVKPIFYRDKKGRLHKIPGYYEYKACAGVELNIVKLPQNVQNGGKILNRCVIETSRSAFYNTESLAKKAVEYAVYGAKNYLFEFFAAKGYIYEIRKKDDKTILHTTFGYENGAKESLKVNIYSLKKFKIPFSDKYSVNEIKIGTGVVSNVIHQKDSWVIVKEKKEDIKIGDYVKPVYTGGFFENLFKE